MARNEPSKGAEAPNGSLKRENPEKSPPKKKGGKFSKNFQRKN